MTACAKWILGAVLLTTCATDRLQAQDYPTANVQIIVPYPAGGGVDLMARSLASELSAKWRKPVIVENVAGANSMIGAQRFSRAAPDGHTLMMTLSGTVVGNRFIYKSLPYDPDKSFLPISLIAKSGQMILASSNSKIDSIGKMLSIAKGKDSKISYGSPGKGSQEQILIETIARKETASLLGVPYKGVSPTLNGLLTGEIEIGVASPGLAAGLINGGQVKALAIAAPRRSLLFPDVPTTGEVGLPYAISTVWYGLFAVAGTPDNVVQKILGDVTAIAKAPDFLEKNVTSRGLELVASSPAEFAATIQTERAAMADIIRVIGLEPE